MWQGPSTGSDVQQLRDHNRSLVLRWLSRQAGLSRSDIAQRVGLTDAAISRIVRDLIDAGLVEEGGPIVAASRPGRRHIGLALVSDAAYAAAVRLTVFDHGVSLVGLTGERIANVRLPEVLSADVGEIPGLVADAVERVVMEAGVPAGRILGLGVVTVGAVDQARGQVKISSIRGLSGQALGPDLEQRLHLPVRVTTAGHALNIAEQILVERRAAGLSAAAVGPAVGGTALLVHVAFGLGASMIIDGRPHDGDRDERLIAHIPVPGGSETCICGARGCLLTLVSGHALMRRLTPPEQRSANGGRLGDFGPDALRHAVHQANAGDRGVAALFYQAGQNLGINLLAATAVLPPERIALAGIVGQARPYAAGVRDGLDQAWARIGQTAPELAVSEMDYGRAAELFTLDEFLLNVPIDVQRLQAA
jgi:predicted NBD/HSP70 family sugar kinase